MPKYSFIKNTQMDVQWISIQIFSSERIFRHGHCHEHCMDTSTRGAESMISTYLIGNADQHENPLCSFHSILDPSLLYPPIPLLWAHVLKVLNNFQGWKVLIIGNSLSPILPLKIRGCAA